MPQLFIAPRGLITVLLFYAIPKEAQVATFESGILLFVIIATSLVMTWAMIKEGKKMGALLDDDLSDTNIMDIESEETKSIDLKITNPIEKGKEVLIKWYFEEGDESIEELGQHYEQTIQIPFELIEYY